MSLWAGAPGPAQMASPYMPPFGLLPSNQITFAQQPNQFPWQQNPTQGSSLWYLLNQNNEKLQSPFSQMRKSINGPANRPTNQKRKKAPRTGEGPDIYTWQQQQLAQTHEKPTRPQQTWLHQQTGPQLQQFVVEDQSAVGVHQQQTGLQKQTGLQQWQTGVHQQQTGLQKQTGLQQWQTGLQTQTGLQQQQTGLQQQTRKQQQPGQRQTWQEQTGRNKEQQSQDNNWQYSFIEEMGSTHHTQWHGVNDTARSKPGESNDKEDGELQQWIDGMNEETKTLANDFQFYTLMLLPLFIFDKSAAGYFIATKLLGFVVSKLGFTDEDSMILLLFVQCVDIVALSRGRFKLAEGYQNSWYQELYEYMVTRLRFGDVFRIGTELFMPQTGPPTYEDK